MCQSTSVYWTLISDDFESGSLNSWNKMPSGTSSAWPVIASNIGLLSSKGLAVTVTTSYSYLYQSELMPSNKGFLSFWFNPNAVIIP